MGLNAPQQAQAANLRTHLTEAAISELLELARQTDPRAWAVFALSFNHRLRATEVLNLRLDGDINWKDRTVRIARLKGSMTTTQALVVFGVSLRCQRYRLCEPISRSASRTVQGNCFTGQKGPLRRWTPVDVRSLPKTAPAAFLILNRSPIKSLLDSAVQASLRISP